MTAASFHFSQASAFRHKLKKYFCIVHSDCMSFFDKKVLVCYSLMSVFYVKIHWRLGVHHKTHGGARLCPPSPNSGCAADGGSRALHHFNPALAGWRFQRKPGAAATSYSPTPRLDTLSHCTVSIHHLVSTSKSCVALKSKTRCKRPPVKRCVVGNDAREGDRATTDRLSHLGLHIGRFTKFFLVFALSIL